MINMHFLLMNKIFLNKLNSNIIMNNQIKFLKIIRRKLNNKNNSQINYKKILNHNNKIIWNRKKNYFKK